MDSPTLSPYRPGLHGSGPDALPAHQLPRLHSRGCVESPAHQDPAGQPRHVVLPVRLLLLENRPTGHELGMGATDPSSHVKPAPQSRHFVDPTLPWYLPCWQTEQSLLRLAAANVPLLHADGASAPATQNEPARQAEHCVSLPNETSLL